MTMNSARQSVSGSLSREQAPVSLHRDSIAPLFSALVGELLDGQKLGCLIANLIEGDLIRRRWPAGTTYGKELDLCKRFRVGRAIVREAVRVLEVRGSARMRRGPNGGLQVLQPSREQTADVVATCLSLLEVTPRQTEEARALLVRAKARIRSPRPQAKPPPEDDLGQVEAVALPFFEELLDAMQRVGRQGAVSPTGLLFHRSRAGQVAWRLVSDLRPQQWLQGIRLGSTSDLCERYRIDRSVLRQAARILESQGLAMTICGRGHGLVAQAPSPASMCRPISCYFAAQGLGYHAGLALFHWLSIEATAMVAERATPADVAQMERALNALETAHPAAMDEAIFRVEVSQYAAITNPLIDLFLLSTKAFASWNVAIGPHTSPRQHDVYLTETRKVAAAIAGRNRAAATAAQAVKNRRIAEVMLPA